ncbi:murein biosynthesis integral membrane protein MurJ [Magnetospirillum sp. UT-4]|uniref:murein biosynthesis integral membrane protein MurJ n=1 Tax=Magnetospirillum sp. UT-4 TaxID=2681467 RepID=UPI00137F9D3D|nr:murein biosynthesis integral membrane protein MurJ [Magnetospirillum sp. UT-4]CAA7616342.1 Protein MurJ homolog [Magnetospirillum sp. UT-4]
MSLVRSIATVGGFTMLSRITGLMREMMIAHFMGAGGIADAFFVAFRLPNLFRSLFAEGAFNAAFIPLFTARLTKDGEAEARSFAEQAFGVMALVLAAVVVVMELAMPWVMWGLAPGFADTPGKLALAVDLARICFPYLLFISLTALQAGVLNALGRFAAAAGTPVLLNLVAMAGLWALTPVTETPGHALAWGTFAAGIMQFAWLAIVVRRAGMPLRPWKPRFSPEIGVLARRIVPGAIGAGVYQVNLVVNTIIASTVADGAVSYLNYADRINQLPLGVVGIAVGTALLPLLTRQLKAGQYGAARDSQNRAAEFALLLTLPAAAALIAIAAPVVRVLFERGQFGPAETAATAQALMAFALGLPAYVLVKVLVPAFFAREDTRTPVQVAGAAMALNIVLNLALIGPLAHVGMALATALSAWFNVVVLALILKRRDLFAMDSRLSSRAPRILAAAAVMGGLLWAGRLLAWPHAHGLMLSILVLAGLVVLGLAAYAVLAHLLGATRWSEVKASLKRQRP